MSPASSTSTDGRIVAWLRSRWADLALYVGVALAATVLGFIVLGLAGHLTSVPITYSADGITYSVGIKSLIENGQPNVIPDLAAPSHYETLDIPNADGIFTLELWLLTRLTSNFVLALNLFALLSYPLIALAAAWVIRRLGFSRWGAGTFALLYALLPFHQSRLTFHVYLAAYFAVPLAVLLVAEVGFGSNQAREGWHDRRVLGIPIWAWLAAAVVGACGVYYAFFCLAAMVFAAVVAAYSAGDIRRLAAPAMLCVWIVFILGLQYIPNYVYWKQAGNLSLASSRVASDSDLFALRMTELVFPMTNHRVAALAKIKAKYIASLAGITDKFAGIANDSSLGVIGVFGFFVLIFWALASPFRAPPSLPNETPSKLATLGVSLFLLATVGGVGEIVAYLGFAGIRAYDRMTVYLGFVSLCAVAWVADALARRIRGAEPPAARGREAIVVLCFLVVLAIGLFDQTSPAMVPDYASTKAVFDSDAKFVSHVESSLPSGAAVFQLPYVPFPESAPVGRTAAYDELRMYLHSKDLRWSAGAYTGRPVAEWQKQVSALPAVEMLLALKDKGFSGVVVDTYGFADGGRALGAQLTAAGSTAARIVSPDGRYVFYQIPR